MLVFPNDIGSVIYQNIVAYCSKSFVLNRLQKEE